ncbi:MAG: hypothetical protein JW934_05520 [Anaerolineae bacterium]|nr:hypothetical protein [Anaerolineae bacterium]
MRFQMRLHQEYDADVVAWLNAQADKTAAIKGLIRTVINAGSNGAQPAAIDLVAIRMVIETVFDEKLSGIVLAGGLPESRLPSQGDPELERKLDDLF